jgi:hypothetical protein
VKVLTKAEASIVEALGQTLFPREGAISVDARDAGVVEYIDRFLAGLSAWDRARIRAMFLLFEVEIAVAHRSPTRFTTASEADRRAYLSSWDDSPLYARRMAFQALRSVFTLAYMADREVERQMGVHDGERVVRELQTRRASLELAPAQVGASK